MAKKLITKLLKILKKPEYFFRPAQLLRFAAQKIRKRTNEFEDVVLPWKLKIRVRTNDWIGSEIWKLGIFDLCVCESIWRLLDPGECAIDVGANIGQMTSLMATKVGRNGKVIAFEPHPEVYEDLLVNVNNWINTACLGQIEIHKVALTDHSGEAYLSIPKAFDRNRGLSSLFSLDEYDNKTLCNVQVKRLDQLEQLQGENTHIGVLKIDVEGHELEVLKGATKLIDKHQIRDIIFEEWNKYPTPMTEFLEEHGYTLFYLGEHFLGIEVGDIKEKEQKYRGTSYPNYLATNEPNRALRRLIPQGWSVFGIGPALLD